jgi:spore coat protein A, manganese oxidase
MTSITRRESLKLGIAVGGAAFLAIARQRIAMGADRISAQLPPRYQIPFKVPPLAQRVRTVTNPGGSPYSATGNFGGGIEPLGGFSERHVYDLTIARNAVDILGNGQKTEIWGYNGITPGPTIRVPKGCETLARFSNVIDRRDAFGNDVYTSVHLHGMASLPPFDGWADDITRPGEYKNYYYPNNRPATLWYHDHGVHRTALNSYMGLAGLYIVEDPDEDPRIPKAYPTDPTRPGLTGNDIPLILTDKVIDGRGQFVFDEGEIANEGLHGDVILVNGLPWPIMEVQRKAYRFRCLNTGISRAYNLYLSNGTSLQVIGTDAGLLEKAAATNRLRVGVAERYEFIIDFSQLKVGDTVDLLNAGLKNHPDYLHTNKVMRFRVVNGGAQTFDRTVLNKLRKDSFNFEQRINQLRAYGNSNGGIATRLMEFERKNGQWTINGRIWGNGVNAVEANPRLGGVEIWRLKNGSGGWNHPIHLHLVDFLMLSRKNGDSPGIRNYEKGFKDVVYLGENEEIDVLVLFGPHEGKYMFHCHNLTHEDHDMMRAFNVGGRGLEPVGSDGTFKTRGQGPWDAKPIPSTGLPPL